MPPPADEPLRAPRASESAGARWLDSAWGPALAMLAVGVAAVALRPPVPIDETRYLEVLHEMHSGSMLLLTLNGQPYPEKPPLLFWLGIALHRLGLPLDLSLRVLPALCSAALAGYVERLGRRFGVRGAGWVQAATFAPWMYAQTLLFDPLLALLVWVAAGTAAERKTLGAWIASALAFFTKGPVAALFLGPLLWAAADEREPRGRRALRLLGWLVTALLPVGAWALLAGRQGGEAFGANLLWKQTAGRIENSFAHSRPFWFYAALLPPTLLPALPVLLGLFRRDREPLPKLVRDWLIAVALSVALLSLVSGKQPHYLLPFFPAASLATAIALRGDERAARWLRWTSAAVLFLFASALAAAWLGFRGRVVARYGSYGEQLFASDAFRALVVIGLVVGIAAAVRQVARRWSARSTLAVHALALGALIAPIQLAAGALVHPRAIVARVRAEPETPRVVYKASESGFLNWSFGDLRLESLKTPEELRAWCEAHPGGLVYADGKYEGELAGLPLERVETDLLSGRPALLERALGERAPPAGPRSAEEPTQR